MSMIIVLTLFNLPVLAANATWTADRTIIAAARIEAAITV
jgi:hypothetical protein